MQAEVLERPASRSVLQIVERGAEITVKEVEDYDTEDEESNKPKMEAWWSKRGKKKKNNHASRY
jgi:hypothetical protein